MGPNHPKRERAALAAQFLHLRKAPQQCAYPEIAQLVLRAPIGRCFMTLGADKWTAKKAAWERFNAALC